MSPILLKFGEFGEKFFSWKSGQKLFIASRIFAYFIAFRYSVSTYGTGFMLLSLLSHRKLDSLILTLVVQV